MIERTQNSNKFIFFGNFLCFGGLGYSRHCCCFCKIYSMHTCIEKNFNPTHSTEIPRDGGILLTAYALVKVFCHGDGRGQILPGTLGFGG